ncbi:MAG: Gfo/Idh/MocA family oxidoreductase [Anaerolineae bacterium]|nr:Gfo/Idh/MocA family oxidoreductase [Anaerolineae bacterium]
MKTIRWGIIGCGNVTEVKSGPGFQKAQHSALVAVMRRDRALAEDYARRHGVPRWTNDAQALIDAPEIDVVYVATPPAFHMDYTLRVARAGKPVYVEKPMARTHAECQAMIAACQQARVPLFVAYYRRRLPRFLKAQELVASGALGEVRFVEVTLYQRPPAGGYDPQKLPWRVIPAIAGAGLFLDLASHTLDALDFILGPIAQAKGFASNQAGLYAAEDIVSGTWTHQTGVHGLGVWCFAAHANEDRIHIVGDQAALSFSTFGTEPLLLVARDGSQTQCPADTPPHVQQPLIQTIVDELNGAGTCPSSGVSAARTSWAMDQMLAAYRAQTGQPGAIAT